MELTYDSCWFACRIHPECKQPPRKIMNKNARFLTE